MATTKRYIDLRFDRHVCDPHKDGEELFARLTNKDGSYTVTEDGAFLVITGKKRSIQTPKSNVTCAVVIFEDDAKKAGK